MYPFRMQEDRWQALGEGPLQVLASGRPTPQLIPEAARKSPQAMEGKAPLFAFRPLAIHSRWLLWPLAVPSLATPQAHPPECLLHKHPSLQAKAHKLPHLCLQYPISHGERAHWCCFSGEPSQRSFSSVPTRQCPPFVALQPSPASTTALTFASCSSIFVKFQPLSGRGESSRPGRIVKGAILPLCSKSDPPQATWPHPPTPPDGAARGCGHLRSFTTNQPWWCHWLGKHLQMGSLFLFRGMS